MTWYTLLVLAVAVERLAELVVARRNAAWTLERDGVEHGRGHYPVMVVLHAGLLAGCLLEPLLADRPFLPGLGWPALALTLLAQVLRWWCITTLGPYWNTRVIVVPGARLVGAAPTASSATRTTSPSSSRAPPCRWCTRRGSRRPCSRWPTPCC